MGDVGDRGGRAEGHRRRGAQLGDGAEHPVQVQAGLGVDDEALAAGLDVEVGQPIGLVDHQVGLERHAEQGPHRGDDVGPEGEVRDEPPVHHVELHAVDPGLLEGHAAVAEVGEIDGQHRRCDLDRARAAIHRVDPTPGGASRRSRRWPIHHRGDTGELRRDRRRAPRGRRRGPGPSARRARRVRARCPARRAGAGRGGRAPRRLGPGRAGRGDGRRRPTGSTPPCPAVALGCGGCDLQHAAAGGRSPRSRRPPSSTRSRRLGRIDDPPVVRRAGPGRATGFRTTVRAAVSDGRAGFRRHHSHDVVVPGRCLVAHPLIDDLIADGTSARPPR